MFYREKSSGADTKLSKPPKYGKLTVSGYGLMMKMGFMVCSGQRMYYSTVYPSLIGLLALASNGEQIVGLWVEGQKYFGSRLGELQEPDDLPVFNQARQWLDSYFAGEQPEVSLVPLAPEGSEFRRVIWQILCDTPYGQTTTYGEIARQMATKMGRFSMSSQAVGGAVGRNPVSIIIPCHRVVGTNGSLTGYASGLARKIRLLELEGVDVSSFSIPQQGAAL